MSDSEPRPVSGFDIMAADKVACEIHRVANIPDDEKPEYRKEDSPVMLALRRYVVLRLGPIGNIELFKSIKLQQIGEIAPELGIAADILVAAVNDVVLAGELDARSGPADAALDYASGRFGSYRPIFDLKDHAERLQKQT